MGDNSGIKSMNGKGFILAVFHCRSNELRNVFRADFNFSNQRLNSDFLDSKLDLFAFAWRNFADILQNNEKRFFHGVKIFNKTKSKGRFVFNGARVYSFEFYDAFERMVL